MKSKKTGSFVALVVVCLIMVGCTFASPPLALAPSSQSSAQASQLITVSAPVGPTAGREGESLTYTMSAKSGVSGDLTYGFNWGDGSYTWSPSAIASHSWPTSGVYIIRAQAKSGDESSEWSEGRAVMIGSEILSRSPLGRPDDTKRYITPHVNEVKAVVEGILSSEWRRNYTDFNALREWVATQINYEYDRNVYDFVDYWQLPIETLERGTGDCEDIAILFCSLLRASGVSADEVYVAVGRPGGTNDYHAYIFERHSTGVWKVMEPQIDSSTSLLTLKFIDLALTYDYSSDIICFNDKYYFSGPPALDPGIFEVEVPFSLWPILSAASVQFECQLEAEEKVTGSVEWLGDDKVIFNWDLNIFGPSDDIVLVWSGKDKIHDFTLLPVHGGVYRLEILKRDFVVRCVRLAFNSSEWQKR